jgi:hypothetical protein
MNSPEKTDVDLSPYDHAPRFMAFEQHQHELTTRLETLLLQSEAQPVEVNDPEGHLLLSEEEISKLWGLFPQGARARAIPNPPVIETGQPLWFAHNSSSVGPTITNNVQEALSLTAHAMAKTNNRTDEDGALIGTDIDAYEMPENGFSDKVKRLVQAGVIVHELAHTVTAFDLWSQDPERQLVFPNGNVVFAAEWISAFANAAEEKISISRYASAYRDESNAFPRKGESLVIGAGVSEELAESITAKLLGFIFGPHGLTFQPFKDREDICEGVQAYLNSTLLPTVH